MEIGDKYSKQLDLIGAEFGIEITPTLISSPLEDIARNCRDSEGHTHVYPQDIIGTDRYDVAVKISRTDDEVYINLYLPDMVSEEDFPGDIVFDCPTFLFQNTNMETSCKKMGYHLDSIFEEREGIGGVNWAIVDYKTNVPSNMSVSNFDHVWYILPMSKKRYSPESYPGDYNEIYIKKNHVEEAVEILHTISSRDKKS